jgi:polysaccharide export outer membrane protein
VGILSRRRVAAGAVLGGVLLVCLLYCLIAPNQYEARAQVALRQEPATALGLEAAEPMAAASVLSAPLQLETLASVLRSERLAWAVIVRLKLYTASGFCGRFAKKFPGFKPEAPDAAAREWLLERFARRLNVQSVPRTLLVQIRFRSHDAALSSAVVNELVRAYGEQQSAARARATAEASNWLAGQLRELKAAMDRDQQRLVEFQNAHGILTTPETLGNGQPVETVHSATLVELEELGRQLAEATTDRILSEAAYRSALQGDPELVASSQAQAEDSGLSSALLEQIRARRSTLEEEQAQLSAEHGPNFPRVIEIGRQLQELNKQKQAEDGKLVERFKSAWQRAAVREQEARKNLDQRNAQAMQSNQAAGEFVERLQEASAAHELYVRVQNKVREAGLLAGVGASNFTVVDDARVPARPVDPDPLVDFAVALFAGLWLALAAALLMERLRPAAVKAALLLVVLAAGATMRAQAPTPSTSGLPSGVAHPTVTEEKKSVPDPRQAPAVWDLPSGTNSAPQAQTGTPQSSLAMPAPIGPGDFLEIGELHTPEFHSLVRVASDGTVTLPMVRDVRLEGLGEQGAARAIEAALVAQGILLHPRVTVLVTAYAGQDVSVLGEVTRPGVYPYTLHHRLLDLLSAASGLAPSAGRLVNVYHRGDPKTAHPVVLDPTGADPAGEHNPELQPGDTVQVSRAGLVYVIGDVVRPGGFAVDPAQGLTVVQALSLAWGPAQNAATGRALLIREQKGGRTLTPLNLKRMLRGQEPDQPVRDRDILFVPDSTAKNLLNKTLESAIQSALGVSIYAGMVYSQRF